MKSLLLILTAIDDSNRQTKVNAQLRASGHRVIEAGSFKQAQALIGNGLQPDLLFLDAMSTDVAATVQVRRLLKKAQHIPMAVIAEPDAMQWRKELESLGASFFVSGALAQEDIEFIMRSIIQAKSDSILPASEMSDHAMPAPNAHRAEEVSCKVCMEELDDNQYFLAASPAMLNIYRQVKLLADSDVPVLILGESGTGKEVIANLIHKHSQRSRHKFLKLNCAAVPYDLLESELFGHQRGAFTGAIKDRAGKFEQANRGTLLLDEIGEMSAQMQAKFLHVLQDGQFTRLGAQESSKADVRVLAATNVHMENALSEKKFREDLYYRLSVLTIHVPPLRERREEIPYLVEEIIRRTSADLKGDCKCIFPQKLLDAALLHDWRGNLRELRNFVTRTIILRDTDAALQELESRIAPAPEPVLEDSQQPATHRFAMRSVISDMKDRTEAQMIQDALEVSGWNRRHAAKYLNISYRGLLYKIQQHRITPTLPREINAASRVAHSVLS